MAVSAVFAYGQQQKRIAIVNTEDDGEPPVKISELTHITDRLREIANKTLPPKSYAVMTQQSIVDFLGSQENMIKECRAAEGCLAKLGRTINADYIGQARIGRFGEDLTIKVELYESGSGNMVNSFTGMSKDIYSLLSVLDENAPALFKKMPGVAGGSAASPFVAGGISGLEKAADYELYGEKRYLANLSTDPPGAVLSFDGVPSASCAKTPCKAELREGSVRIIAALEQYETADTTVHITHNNQNITVRLKANFGVLEIRPAYLDGIGYGEDWDLVINNKKYYSLDNRFSPGNYNVKLSHECYEAVSFTVGINKNKREVFDMSGNITLKKGGLDLSAERDGEPVSEPVFLNGKQIGETPFSGAVPVCADIRIGKNREKVNVRLKHNEKVTHTARISSYKSPVFTRDDSDITNQIARIANQPNKPERKIQEKLEREKQSEPEQKKQDELAPFKKPRQAIGGGGYLNVKNINPEYDAGGFLFINAEFVSIAGGYLRFGADVEFGSLEIYETIAKNDTTEEKVIKVFVFRGGPSAKLSLGGEYHWLFLSGGANWYIDKSHSGPSFSVGGGIRGRIFFDAQHYIMPMNNRNVNYWTLRGGFSLPW